MKRLTLITGIENNHCKDVLRGLYWNCFKQDIGNLMIKDTNTESIDDKILFCLFWPENKIIENECFEETFNGRGQIELKQSFHVEPIHSSKQVELINSSLKDFVNNPNINMFILTQSEYFFNAIRVACREKLIDFNDVEVIWVSGKYSDYDIPGEFNLGDDVEDHFMIDKIKIDGSGCCDQWPRDFFNETEKLLMKLF